MCGVQEQDGEAGETEEKSVCVDVHSVCTYVHVRWHSVLSRIL
jgi:hypothetical protein